MEFLRLPPRIKVLEALSAVYGDRVRPIDEYRCEVVSSDKSRIYHVYVDLSRRVAYSDDNGTMLRGYVGYPIISFLMYRNVLPKFEDVGKILRDFPWRAMNEKYKKYELVMNEVYKILQTNGISRSSVDKYINDVLSKLKNLKLRKLPHKPI